MNLKNKNALFIMVLCFMGIIIFFNYQKTPINQNYALSEEQYAIEKPNEEIKNSVEIINDQFVQEGNSQDISLYNSRSLEFINHSTESEGITVINPINGWNMSSFTLDFKNLTTTNQYVRFETRNDNSFQFSSQNIYYATSFRIPNTSYLKNISMFIQYPGGEGPNQNRSSSFSIKIYNSTDNMKPDTDISDPSDETLFDLSGEPITLAAQWYQSNYSNQELNISRTYNNTFFAVFRSIEFPSGSFGSPNAYLFYAKERENDPYDLHFYDASGSDPTWGDEITGLNGMLKVNLAPISTRPTPDEVNLTVYGNEVNPDGTYEHSLFIEHENNRFDIPITSEWFAPVEYNLTFSGNFKYNKQTATNFQTTNENVIWNSTTEIVEFPGDSYNRIARFYNPSHWNYNQTYKDFFKYETLTNKSDYVDVYNIQNNHNWTIQYLQRNNVIDSSIWESRNNQDWITVGNKVNFTNYIKINSNFNNTNGKALMQVSVDDKIDLINSQNVSVNQTEFEIWRPDIDTSIQNNESLITLHILTYNGTIAGITSYTLGVQVYKDLVSLSLKTNIKNEYVWGESLFLEVLLKSKDTPLEDQSVKFIINEIYSEGNIQAKTYSDITNTEGLAQIDYEINQVSQLEVIIQFNGTLYYQEAKILKSNIIVKSPTVRFFLNLTPFLIIGLAIVISYSAYYIVQKRRFQKRQELWDKKTDLFSDILSIDYILIINKASGSNIVQKELGDVHFEAGLVSGFLQAISSFKYELKKKTNTDRRARETILLDYQDYKILLKDGEYIRVALVLNQEPSKNLEESLIKFINDFETKYEKYLKKFTGEVTQFKNFMHLVNQHFNTSMLKPHITNENPPSNELDSFQKKILDIAKTIEADRERFYISKLLNYLFSAMPEEPKNRIIANVYDLSEKECLIPVPIERSE